MSNDALKPNGFPSYKTSPLVRDNGLREYENLKSQIPNVDHKEYERRAKEAARKARI